MLGQLDVFLIKVSRKIVRTIDGDSVNAAKVLIARGHMRHAVAAHARDNHRIIGEQTVVCPFSLRGPDNPILGCKEEEIKCPVSAQSPSSNPLAPRWL